MNVRGATVEQLQQAAREVGVNLYNLHPCGKTERSGYAFKLKTGGEYTESGRRKGPPPRYRRFSRLPNYRTGRRQTIPGAVCWHGHRDFFRALYRLAPHARIRTAMAVYLDSAHFERTFRATWQEGGERMGAPMVPSEVDCSCTDEEHVK